MLRRRSASSRWPGLFALGALSLAAGLALAAFFARPRLIASAPAAGLTDVSPRARLHLTFDRPMDPASVEAALRTEPAVPGDFIWDTAGQTVTFRPAAAWPVLSPVTVTLAGGRSRAGLPVLEREQWSFTVGQERLVYLTAGVPNVALLSLAEGAAPELLTAEPYGVIDFTLHPDTGQIVYAARRADGGADLRLVSPDGAEHADLLPCPEAACLAARFSPDGTRLAYERQTPLVGAQGVAGFGDPRVHVYTLATGADQALGDPGNQARAPQWSPDGRVSFYDTARQALVVVNPDTGAVTYVPATSGEAGTWSPDGQRLVYAEIVFLDNAITLTGTLAVTDNVPINVAGFYSHLFQVTVATNAAVDLSASSGGGPGVVEDASPVYSLDGAWLAFGRKPLQGATWTPGRQLWLMRADGSEARPLTAEPPYNHSAFAWNPDSQRLAYMRLDATDPNALAEIWLIHVDGSGARRLVAGGFSPEWLP